MIRHLLFTEDQRQALLVGTLDSITLNEISQVKKGDIVQARTGGFAKKAFARLKVTQVFYEGCPTTTRILFKVEAIS